MSANDPDPPSLAGRRFVVLGEGRLVSSVTQLFEARHARATPAWLAGTPRGPSVEITVGRPLALDSAA